ncbi:hypothetical protein DSM104299_00529 [Baekduia alba]|uniref:hypothetical protein n=1 Tax=Baekduia alba TaxID=2997333 RepID=UPI002340B9E2|nr:hypothetical protein [Baekduia alba]WCB91851.1 hypothetical protein DSM104299_00529 [Baekduia alba]
MIPRPRTVVLWFIGFVIWALVALWVVATSSMLGDDGGDAARHARDLHAPAAARDLHPGRAAAASADAAHDAGGGLLGDLWGLVEPPLLIAVVGGLGLAGVRVVARRREGRVRLRLLPHRDEALARRDVEGLLGACHELLRETPLRAALLGPPTLGLELETAPGAAGTSTAALALVCPGHLVPALESALQDRCPDSRLVAEPATTQGAVSTPTMHLMRPRSTRRPGTVDGDHVLAVLDVMAATGAPARLQYALAAARAPAGSRRRPAEVGWTDADADAPFEPTRTATAAGVAPVAAAARTLPMTFHVDVRVAAASRPACVAIAQAAAAGAGVTVPRIAPLRGGMGAPLRRRPRATTTSAELAGAWHLPAAAHDGPQVARSSVPRLSAPARVSRASDDALVRDERGPAGLDDAARRAGLGVFGGSDAARRALVGRWLARRAAADEVPVLVVATAPGGAAAARAVLEPEREVSVVDLADPAAGFDPLAEPGEPEALGTAVAAALLGAGAGDVPQEAQRVLALSVAVAIAAGRAGALEAASVPRQALRLLDPSEGVLREGLARELYRRRGGAGLASFLGHELPAHLNDAAGDAARAALDGPRADALGAAGGAGRTVGLGDLLRHRQALVLDAAAPAAGAPQRGALARLALAGLGATLRDAAPPGRSATVRAALLIDGADDVIDDALAAELLALGDAGLELAATWRYGRPLADAGARSRALRLLAHRCLLGLDAAAEDDLPAATAVCDDVLAADERVPDRAALSARGALALPDGYALCSWALDGAGRATFIARAVPIGAAAGN